MYSCGLKTKPIAPKDKMLPSIPNEYIKHYKQKKKLHGEK